MGEVAAELFGRGRGGRAGFDPGQDQRGVVTAKYIGDRDGAGFGDPAQAQGFGAKELAGAPCSILNEYMAATSQQAAVVLPQMLAANLPQLRDNAACQLGNLVLERGHGSAARSIWVSPRAAASIWSSATPNEAPSP